MCNALELLALCLACVSLTCRVCVTGLCGPQICDSLQEQSADHVGSDRHSLLDGALRQLRQVNRQVHQGSAVLQRGQVSRQASQCSQFSWSSAASSPAQNSGRPQKMGLGCIGCGKQKPSRLTAQRVQARRCCWEGGEQPRGCTRHADPGLRWHQPGSKAYQLDDPGLVIWPAVLHITPESPSARNSVSLVCI